MQREELQNIDKNNKVQVFNNLNCNMDCNKNSHMTEKQKIGLMRNAGKILKKKLKQEVNA